MGKDYYSTLEINRNAKNADIKKSYRRLALKYHPHCNTQPGAYGKFTELCEAYDVLSDLRKKAIYDKFGEEGLKRGIPLESAESNGWSVGYVYHGNPEKTFRQFFGVDSPFADGNVVDFNLGGNRGRWEMKQDPAIEQDLHVGLEDLFYGCLKKMKISRHVMNEDGKTTSIEEKILTIQVQPGWYDGTRVKFSKEGDERPNYTPADIDFIIRQKPHHRFTRHNNDLIYTETISLEKALTGFSVDVETLDGRLINIPINEIVHPEYTKLVPGEGMPLPSNPSAKGDLLIKFKTIFPENLGPEKKRLVKQVFAT